MLSWSPMWSPVAGRDLDRWRAGSWKRGIFDQRQGSTDLGPSLLSQLIETPHAHPCLFNSATLKAYTKPRIVEVLRRLHVIWYLLCQAPFPYWSLFVSRRFNQTCIHTARNAGKVGCSERYPGSLRILQAPFSTQPSMLLCSLVMHLFEAIKNPFSNA